MSALILIQHVKRGAEIAKEHKLGMDILDTIQQHHGTSLIKYFYNKSIGINGKDAVKEDNFRYPGPKPQTRETGIVMLADVVEAAMRTLDRPTSSRICGPRPVGSRAAGRSRRWRSCATSRRRSTSSPGSSIAR